MKTKQVLVLFSYRSHKRRYIEMLFERLREAAKGRALELHRGALSDMQICVVDNQLSIRESLTGKDIAGVDLVYFELWYKAPEQALAVALYADRAGVPFFSRELLTAMPLTKVGEIAKLADAGISLPRTFTSSNRILRDVFRNHPPLHFPLVVKAADGYGGHNNFLAQNYQEFEHILDEHKDLRFVVQEFIPNDRDYRCLVMGGEIVLVLERSRAADAHTHVNNTSQGGEGVVIPVDSLPHVAREDVLRAAARLGRSEFAGVDLIIDKNNGQHYILEVNQTPQIEIGAEVNHKMSALLDYFEQRVGGV